MAINPLISLMGRSPDMVESATQGAKSGADFVNWVIGSQVNRMRDIEDPAQRQAFANKNFFGRQLRAQLKEDEAAALKAQLEQQKALADIYNTLAQGGERIANAGKTTQETGANRYGLGRDVWMAVTQSGNPNAGKMLLNRHLASGAIDQPTYDALNSQLTALEGQEPSAIQSTAFNQAKSTLDPKYNFATVDAQEANAVSLANNQNTVNATLAGQQIQKEIADNKLEFDKSQTSALFTAQQQDIKDGKAKLEVINGVTYLDYGNGRGEIYVDKNGQPMKPVSSTKPESRAEIIERKEKAQNFAAASRSAADGATLAASILKRYQALNYNPVQFAAASRIPGSEAYNIVRDTETLKSNIFLARAGDMRGLGALTESEGAKLENSFGSLDPSQGNQFITNLRDIARQFSSIAKNNANKTGLYMGRDGNVVQTTQKPAATAETKPPSPKGLTMSLSEVKQAAQGAGISTEQAVQQLRSQGVIIK